MKYALVNGDRQEAKAGLRGVCQACELPMTPKCGQQRIHHWAHRTVNCDAWWERETLWHRDWKNEFPQEWQENRITGTEGDFHIADVRTQNGTVLEFQHSHLSPIERRLRETFYGNMAWIVDGMRNGKDPATFASFLSANIPDYGKVRGWRFQLRRFPLVDNWVSATCPVYLDFGDTMFPGTGLPPDELLWRIKKAPTGRVIVTPFSRQNVINHYKLSTPLEGFAPHPRPNGPQDYRSMDWPYR